MDRLAAVAARLQPWPPVKGHMIHFRLLLLSFSIFVCGTPPRLLDADLDRLLADGEAAAQSD